MSDRTDEWVVKFIERVRFVIIENNIVANIELSKIVMSTLNEKRSKDCFQSLINCALVCDFYRVARKLLIDISLKKSPGL